MNVYDFCNLALDDCQRAAIWSLNDERVIFEGTCNDIMESDYADEEVQSFDIDNNVLTLNVELES